MRNAYHIYMRELRSYFVSPIAYVVIALFLTISGIFFYLLLQSFIEMSIRMMMQAQQFRMQVPAMNVNQMVVRSLFLNMSVITLFMLPMITMKLFSDEKRTGTIELLLTSPITNWEIIIGKFFAALTVYLAMIFGTTSYISVLFIYGNPELMPIVAGYIGLAFMGALTIAVGTFISSLTENQIIAAVGCFGAMMILWFVGWAANFVGPPFGEVLRYMSVMEHFQDFAKGVIDSSDIAFYVSFGFFSLFLTYQAVESAKWRG